MTNNVDENTERTELGTTGSIAGPAGSLRDSGEKPADISPATPKNNELRWMQKHEKPVQHTAGQSHGPGNTSSGASPAGKIRKKRVQRKTYLRGQAIDPPRYSKQSIRMRTERELADDGSDIPYTAWEKVTRSLVCSLVERQDRLSEQFLLKVNDLEYRIDDLEQDLADILQKLGKVT